MSAKDPIWKAIREELAAAAREEPMLASFLHATVLKHQSLEDALSFHLAGMLGCATIDAMAMRETIDEAFKADLAIGEAIRADLAAVRQRDPACRGYYQPLLFFKGFHALQSYRAAHWLWGRGREMMALFLQSRMSQVFGADIHPAARIGKGILVDHATGIVIGETAVVEDDVSILHEVTLGGTGKETGDRHPKVRRGVLIGAGAKILGNIEIGEGAKIAAGSVVLKKVPPHTSAAGVPARMIGKLKVAAPALDMDQTIAAERRPHGEGI
jgi:serine O-acetyltransferase